MQRELRKKDKLRSAIIARKPILEKVSRYATEDGREETDAENQEVGEGGGRREGWDWMGCVGGGWTNG